MTIVRLTGWQDGLRKVSLAKVLQKEAGMSLSDAKGAVDRLLEGEVVEIPATSDAKAGTIAARATEVGALCSIVPSRHPT